MDKWTTMVTFNDDDGNLVQVPVDEYDQLPWHNNAYWITDDECPHDYLGHHWVNVGFTSEKFVCKHCDKEKK